MNPTHTLSTRCAMRRRCQPRDAFTLVELLVVISIIAILMGLLIPAVNSAREVARRNQCATQQKNFALAAMQYEGSKKALPAWLRSYGTFAGGPDPSEPNVGASGVMNPPPHVKLGTWAVAVLPWLDAQPTYEHWTEDRYPILDGPGGARNPTGGRSGEGYHELAAPNLAIFQCPSNPNVNGNAGKNSYIYNNGMSHERRTVVNAMGIGTPGTPTVIPSSPPPHPTLSVLNRALLASMDKANGVGVNAYAGSRSGAPATLAPVGEGVTLSDMRDGQGNTIMFSENVQAMPWHRVGFINPTLNTGTGLVIANVGEQVDYPQTSRFAQGLVWHYEDPTCPPSPNGTPLIDCQPVYQKHLINGAGLTVSEDIFVEEMTAENCIDLARPSSAHVDGVNCGMGDGATRFITRSIDYRVYQALLTPRGKSSNVPWPEFVMTDEAF